MPEISIKEMLAAGVHFGHQRRYWNPLMKKYIFGIRNGIHIIDLHKTEKYFQKASDFLSKMAAEKKIILFVGTKKQAQTIIEEEAQRGKCYYVNRRWLGGMLTNFKTIKQSIKKLKEIEKDFESGKIERLTKKEQAKLEKKRVKLEFSLGGIKDMPGLPDVVIIADVKRDQIALQEANKMMIPIIGITDTNSSPKGVNYIIPANDDAIRSIRLVAATLADSIIEGRSKAPGVADKQPVAAVKNKNAAPAVAAGTVSKPENAAAIDDSKNNSNAETAKKVETKTDAEPANS